MKELRNRFIDLLEINIVMIPLSLLIIYVIQRQLTWGDFASTMAVANAVVIGSYLIANFGIKPIFNFLDKYKVK